MQIDQETGEIIKPQCRTRYNYNADEASHATGLCCMEETRTQQQFKDECDINTIVKRFGLTGELPTNLKTPLEGDFIETTDYHTAMNQIIAANEAFGQLPATVRDRFQNDPGKFVAFASDPKNYEEAVKLGLAIAKPPEPAKPAAEPAKPAAGPAPSPEGT